MKGIVLAGGKGTRLYPATKVISKQLLPVYDKPMIYYPLSTLMLTGIRDICIISTPVDIDRFKELLGDGKWLGMNFEYKVQEKSRGLADAFLVAEDFIGNDSITLVLGDNIFYGSGLVPLLKSSVNHIKKNAGAVVFGYYVNDPKNYGVVSFDKAGKVLSIEEKPESPKSNYAVIGLYFYDNKAVKYAKRIKPSKRGELEITDLNKIYLDDNELTVKLMGRGFAWLDTGTHDSMAEATEFVKTIEKRQGLKISCIEEIAWRMGFIDDDQLLILGGFLETSGYGEYLKGLVKNK